MSPYFSSHCLGVNLGGSFFSVKDGDCFHTEDGFLPLILAGKLLRLCAAQEFL